METARQIAERFVGHPPNIDDLERAILRHMEHHIFEARKVEREACARVAEAPAWSAPTETGEWALREAAKVIAHAIRSRKD